MPICRNLKLCFIHVPKTAGSSIEKALNWQGANHLIGPLNKKYNVCPQHLYWSEIKEEVPEAEKFLKFSIVRNPFDRLVSEYFYAKQYKCRPNSFVKDLSFTSFVDEFLKLPGKDRQFIFDRHLEPQVNFIKDCENLNLFYFENLEKCFSFLSSVATFDKVPRQNCSRHENWNFYYSEEIKSKVYNFYKEDFDKLGYSV
jgi:hypothetical protein